MRPNAPPPRPNGTWRRRWRRETATPSQVARTIGLGMTPETGRTSGPELLPRTESNHGRNSRKIKNHRQGIAGGFWRLVIKSVSSPKISPPNQLAGYRPKSRPKNYISK